MLLLLFGVALATLLVYLWQYLSKINRYWDERGVLSMKPYLFFGNNLPLLMRKKTLNAYHKDIYDNFPDAPYYGYYEYMKPVLVIKDPDLVERVIIKDFQHFVNRGFEEFGDSPLTSNLTNMTGNKWRAMRSKLSPLFTTGRLRHMVPQMRELSDGVVKTLEKKHTEVDLRDLFQRFAMDIIASCAFGMNVNTLEEEEESEFRKMGKRAFAFGWKQLLQILLISVFPKLAKKLGSSQFEPVVTKYFSDIIKETIAHRKKTGKTRNDFVQLFVALQQKGSIEFEGNDQEDDYLVTEGIAENEKKTEYLELTDDVMVGQAFVFLIAGFEGSAISMLYMCFELALNQEVQAKAREEVVRVVKNREGVLDYDALKDMTYFGQCVQETLRLHTFAGVLFRKCTKDYTFPGTSLSIKTGQTIYIPTIGMHMDPNYYEDPDKFRPERFAADVSRKNSTYLPFGDGPRVCIAMRFAMTEINMCIARILLNYTIRLNPKTKLPIEISPLGFGEIPKTPILFDFIKVGEAS